VSGQHVGLQGDTHKSITITLVTHALVHKSSALLSRARTSARVAALAAQAASVVQARSPAFSARCGQCGAAATVATRVVVNDVVYHRRCLKCAACGVALTSDRVEFVDRSMFCHTHANDARDDAARFVAAPRRCL